MDRDHRSDDELPKLSSLAQAARSSQLKQIRGTLIAIGIFILIFNVIDAVTAPGQVREGIAKQGGNAPGAPDVATFTLVFIYTVLGLYSLVGVLFIILGALVHRFPVPITLTAFIVYTLTSIVCILFLVASLQPAAIVGIIFRIVFIIALGRAVYTAFQYQREQKAQLAAAEGDLDEETYE
jgi:hypothetical protein